MCDFWMYFVNLGVLICQGANGNELILRISVQGTIYFRGSKKGEGAILEKMLTLGELRYILLQISV